MATTGRSNSALLERLQGSGLRPTPQRELVFQVILDKRDHPTAEDVFARVKSRMPTISLATVYNCLETLVSCGLVRSVNFERGPTRYCPNLHPHAHFHDVETGATYDIDLPDGLLDEVKTILPPGYAAASVEIIFRGTHGSLPAESAEKLNPSAQAPGAN